MAELQATCFGLIRHAPTRWNEERRIQGRLDSPLTKHGRDLALLWGKQLANHPWQRILCSDQERARQTTELINHTLGLPLECETLLGEQDWGNWSGLTLTGLQADHRAALAAQVRQGWLFTPPGGESRRQVLERVLAALASAHRRRPGEQILVVCHEGVIKCLLYHLAQRKFLPEEPRIIEPYHLHLVEARGTALYLQAMNRLALATEPVPDP